jgi:copper chaperone CopZ
MIETVYAVEGMTCEHCEHRVSAEVSEIQGVTSAVADASAGTVQVLSSHPLEQSDVRAAIEEAGYELADA